MDIITAHKFSVRNRKALKKDIRCGCFYCLEIFSPKEIEDWIDGGETAQCPFCWVDSVIGESSGAPITKEFLNEMNEYWFSVAKEPIQHT